MLTGSRWIFFRIPAFGDLEIHKVFLRSPKPVLQKNLSPDNRVILFFDPVLGKSERDLLLRPGFGKRKGKWTIIEGKT